MPRTVPLLEVTNLTKAFGGVMAVNDLSFRLAQGQLKAIIGPNGAGKTTLFNLITGVVRATAGTISFNGTPITGSKPHVIATQGIARTFQTPRLFPNLTVAENVMVGRHPRTTADLVRTAVPLGRTKTEERQIREDAMRWLRFFGIEKRARLPAETIPFGERRILEIARALATEPQLLLLDEPAAGLNDAERSALARLLREIQRKGITILWVEHHMRMVMSIADEVMVMDWGKKIGEGTAAEVQRDSAVIEAYLGSGRA